MIELRTGRQFVTAPLTLPNITALLEQATTSLAAGHTTFDLSEVPEADSSALSWMLELVRLAQTSKQDLSFAHPPQGVRALAELYGITDLIPLSA